MDMPIRVTSGFRSFEEQDRLYAQGRTTAGQIVTNARGGESMHNFGVAFDYCFKGTEPYPPTTNKKWKTVNDIAEVLGFYSYGNSLKWDYGHLQLMFDYSEKDFREGKVDYSRYK
jgi:peptidoglycan LD-endopeptidase CwlK